MNDKNRNLAVRVVSALVLLPAVLVLLVLGGWWTAGLVSVAAALCTLEYLHITTPTFGVAQLASVLGAGAMPLAAAARPDDFGALVLAALGAVFLVAWISQLPRGPSPEGPVRAAHAVTGCLYGGLGLAPVVALRLEASGLQWVISALVITWANDTCAYFAGRLFGRHKLSPAVSPNKTWEGFAGGMAGSIGGMFVARWVAFPSLQPRDCLVLGVLGGVLGPLGDLCESLLKRAYGAKDSGRIIPGHGGLLDRVDALLFNAPAVFLYVRLLPALQRGAL